MKTFIFFLLFVFFLFGTAYLITNISNGASNEIRIREKNIGKSVVLKKDTLTIIDYSFINNTYTLEDGRDISVELLETIKVTE